MSDGPSTRAPAATPAPARRRSPRYSRVKGAPRILLTEDDLRILREAHALRVVRSTDIERLLPWRGSKHLQHRLRRLYDNGYLDRLKEDALAGQNPPMIYALGNRGAEAIGVRRSGVDWADKNRTYGNRQLQHALLVTEFCVAIRWSCFCNQIRFISREDVLDGSPRETQALARPYQWRISVSRPGKPTVHETVRPDYIFGLEFPQHPRRPGMRRHFMLEADRGTEPQRRSEPKGPYTFRRLESIADKLYLFDECFAAWQEGRGVKPFGFKNFYVLVVTGRGPQRVANMVAESKRMSNGEGVFSHWFADSGTLEEHDALTMPWVNGKGETVRIAEWLVRGH